MSCILNFRGFLLRLFLMRDGIILRPLQKLTIYEVNLSQRYFLMFLELIFSILGVFLLNQGLFYS